MTRALITLTLILIANICQAQYVPELFSWGDFGTTEIYAGGSNGVELILTDQHSLPDARLLASHLSRTGKLAAILSIEQYLQQQNNDKRCFDAATPLAVYAQDVQQHHHFFHFEPAFITALGTAGDYLFAMLSQIPKGVFRGAYSQTIGSIILLPNNLCQPNPAVKWNQTNHLATLNFYSAPATPWRSFTEPEWLKPWFYNIFPSRNWLNERDNFERHLMEPTKTSAVNAQVSVDSLPLVEVLPLANQQYSQDDLFAVVISGDGGWANIDKDIANSLAAKGIAVVGWNSLDYFWEGKTPEIAGRDLQLLLDTYSARWHKNKILLIGFSMGADVMPFMVNRLNATTQRQLLSVNLLNPSTNVDFTFHLSGWLNNAKEAPYKLYPEVKDWQQWITNCFYSTREQSLCDVLAQHPPATVKQQLFYLEGDHHFNGDVAQLVELILNHTPTLN
ncbi:AcvB/VirJ family lysyl-phosphatidylglycerol hydrolase [Cellvibrio sp. OA-2007]|uniref:AcvB/VirJ family lysyl-phosphatidylglycerol hydrolase n=1 Tax=Cellvibrio sp. OA-2007 TaxID=529823 RepID=UPI0007805087|nr:AcvB/VirJ family lysyl-phosphatidylglycerol hydrolase [Cellvibrio sp. OA-2007]